MAGECRAARAGSGGDQEEMKETPAPTNPKAPKSKSEVQRKFKTKIVSGGQTGADRAALDFALAHKIPQGGWCPKGRRAEDGVIEPCYRLVETPSSRYSQRTAWNVRDSDAT